MERGVVWSEKGSTINFGGFGGFSLGQFESNINQGSGNQSQGESNYRSSINIPQVYSHYLESFLNLKAINKLNIPKIISLVKINKFNDDSIPAKLGTINTAPNQPADKLMNNSEQTENQSESILNIGSNGNQNSQLLSMARRVNLNEKLCTRRHIL